MIHPRPTTHISAEPFGLFTIGVRVEQWGRVDAWCACGAKLSRYRSLGDIACAPCQLRAATPDPFELHPKPYVHKKTPPRHYGTHCPTCGGVKDKRAQQCRSCRYGLAP